MTAYATAVVAGAVVVGRLVRLACERHLRDMEHGHERGLRFDTEIARQRLDFFPDVLRLAEGEHAGLPFVLQAWQGFVVGSLFGWIGPDGYRRFRTCYAEIGKGNGKSPLGAGIGLVGLVADGEVGAEIYSAATTRDQAKIVWGDADKMVKASPMLRDRITTTVNNLAFLEQGSIFRPVSADASKLDGLRCHIVIADEVHEHPSDLVINKMRAGFKGRRQPLMIEITNSGWDRHSICWQHRDYSVKVLEGVIENDSWFAYVCTLDEGDDWRTDEACWVKANPNIDVSITRKYLREQVQEARDMPAKENIVARLNFCQWTEQAQRLVSMEMWDKGREPFDEQELRGRPCYVGLDLSKVNDLSSAAFLFPPSHPLERWKAVMRYWIPEDDIEPRVRKDSVPYDVWVRNGLITTTPGNATAFKRVREDITALCGIFSVQELAYDRMFANETTQALQEEGLTVVEFGQGFVSMAAPTAELLRLLLAEELQHGGHPVLRWNVSNLAAQQDAAGNLKPDKAHSTERIDGAVALIMAIGRAMTRPLEFGSVYEHEGIATVGGP